MTKPTITDEDRKAAIIGLEHESVFASVALGKWLSAALDDPNVCEEMKADIRRWFSSGHLYWDEVQAYRQAAYAAGLERAAVIAEEAELYEDERPWYAKDKIATAIRAEKDET